MKTTLLALLCLVGLSACHEFKASTSHFGHGTYRCYYYHHRLNEFFKGVSTQKMEAMEKAETACVAVDGYHYHEKPCSFADCVFK
ncbi:MAG TPA: hypothetical protein VI844_02445 [Coxiellaceae bacterium]|nr:hypothetical protein [Coxiellaceae bacterium]